MKKTGIIGIVLLLLVCALAACSPGTQENNKASLDYEMLAMDRTRPILPSLKKACIDAFLSDSQTKGLTLSYLAFSKDYSRLYLEARTTASDTELVFFAYDIATGTLSRMEQAESTLPLSSWDNLAETDKTQAIALCERILYARDEMTLNMDLYNTMLVLFKEQPSVEHIDAVTYPRIYTLPCPDHYCLYASFQVENDFYTYQIFCDYEDNVLEKQCWVFSVDETSSSTYYGDLEEYRDPHTVTLWEDEKTELAGIVKQDNSGRYYLQLSSDRSITLIEYEETFPDCNAVYFFEDMSEYENKEIAICGRITNYRGGGELYWEDYSVSAD